MPVISCPAARPACSADEPGVTRVITTRCWNGRTSIATVAGPLNARSLDDPPAGNSAKCERPSRPSISLITARVSSIDAAAAAFGRNSDLTAAQFSPPNVGS